MKRTLDIIVAAVAVVILAPIFVAIAVAIVIEAGFPIFFRQVRIGRHLEPFVLLKFRTMIEQHNGPEITASDDSRVTGVGRFLRSSKLDELPQLLNVIKGDMSVVGPRPEVPRFVAFHQEAFRRVMTVRPGITGPASLQFRDEEQYLAEAADPEREYVEVVLPAKLEIDESYLESRTLGSDLRIMWRTLGAIVRRDPARMTPGGRAD